MLDTFDVKHWWHQLISAVCRRFWWILPLSLLQTGLRDGRQWICKVQSFQQLAVKSNKKSLQSYSMLEVKVKEWQPFYARIFIVIVAFLLTFIKHPELHQYLETVAFKGEKSKSIFNKIIHHHPHFFLIISSVSLSPIKMQRPRQYTRSQVKHTCFCFCYLKHLTNV